jgi:hypothetical protein
MISKLKRMKSKVKKLTLRGYLHYNTFKGLHCRTICEARVGDAGDGVI